MSEFEDRLGEAFEQALALAAGADRSAFLAALGSDDPELASELVSLLAAHEAAGNFLEEPALNEAAALIPEGFGDHLLGTSMGPWHLDSLIHEGGMGSVFRATRIEDEFTQVGAVKVVRVGFETELLIERFTQERQLLASVEHPHVARFLDGGTTDEGLPWLAMEYVDGETIHDFADQHQLNIRQRLALFDQLADAISHLHQNLITHRDLKSSNVLVDAGGHVRVLDFGVSSLLSDTRSVKDASASTQSSSFVSYASAAPEQIDGGAVSTATDVYALGVLLYRLLCGSAPYRISSDQSGEEILDIVCRQLPPLASVTATKESTASSLAARRQNSANRLSRTLRGDLDAILAKALRKKPEDRYRSVAELRNDVALYLENRSVAAQPNTPVYRSGKFLRRHWRGMTATTVAMLALVVGMAMALWQAEEARRQRDRAQAMNDFMQEVLAEADPYEANLNKTVREALVEASELLDDRFANQPLLESSLRTSVAQVQLSFLDLDEGEANLQRALALLDVHVPHDDEDRLRIEASLAWARFEREDYEGAAAAYQGILDRLSSAQSNDFRAVVHNDTGVVLMELERWEESIVLQEAALRLSPQSEGRFASIINIGYAYDGLGQLERAKVYYLQAIEELHALGEAGVVADLGHALNNYGNILSQQDQDEAALPFYLESLDVRYRVYGENSDSVAAQHLNVGRLLLDMKQPAQALEHLSTAIEIFPLYRDESSIYLRVGRASHARAWWLSDSNPDSRRQALATLERIHLAMLDDDSLRSSRFVEQIGEWAAEAKASLN